jgi:iron complex transport system ATP-binding protein
MRLEAKNLIVGYNKNKVLSGLNLTLEEGEVISLIGKNGIGKSTLLKTLIGELKPIGGEVLLNGENLSNYSRKKLSERLAIVTTDRSISGGLTVREIASMGRHPHTGLFGKLSLKDKEIVDNAMRDVGIYRLANKYYSELSDGEKQKTMIARAIAQEASLIILDEPFSFLDPASRIEILMLLKNIASDSDTGILFSSHDVAQSVRMADRIWLIDRNYQLWNYKPEELVKSNHLNEMFDNKEIKFDTTQNDFIV